MISGDMCSLFMQRLMVGSAEGMLMKRIMLAKKCQKNYVCTINFFSF
jgi:hypothetical protein